MKIETLSIDAQKKLISIAEFENLDISVLEQEDTREAIRGAILGKHYEGREITIAMEILDFIAI